MFDYFFDCFVSFARPDNTLYFTRDGVEQHMAVNFLSPLLLTVLLAPALARARGARVVNVSSVVRGAAPLHPTPDGTFKAPLSAPLLRAQILQ